MKEKKTFTIDYKRIVYTLSMLALCAVAFVRAVGGGDWWNAAISCVGFCLFPVIVIRFGFKSFLKIPYLIWLLISSPAAYFIIKKYYYSAIHRMAFALLVVECVVYGLILIRIIFGLFKKEFKDFFIYKTPLFYIVGLFFVLSTVSINKAIWPIFFGVYFIAFFMAPADKEDDEKLFVSLCDSLILAFFLIQSFAFLHRPYDQARYVGAYTNANVNAMFYYCVYLGMLGKYSFLRKHNAKKGILIPHFLFASVIWSFALLTISRGTLVSFVLTTIIYLIISECIIVKKNFWKGFLLNGVLMFLAFAVSFPLAFICVRYIPPLRHHPIWITEYSEDFVHSYDPWNSEKYIEIDEFIDELLGRMKAENFPEEDSSDEESYEEESKTTIFVLLKRYASSLEQADEEESNDELEYIVLDDGMVIQYPDGVMPGADEWHPAYSDYREETFWERIVRSRPYIYKYFLRNLTWEGHEVEYPLIYIFYWKTIPHAHNSYLQIAYSFGIIPGILYLIISLTGLIIPIVYIFVKKDKAPWYFAFITCAQFGIILMGLTENLAMPGKMLFSLVFLCLLPITYINQKKSEHKNMDN